MINEIHFTGCVYARNNEGGDDTALISILDKLSPLIRPNPLRFAKTMYLNFKDRGEEDFGDEPGSWPDEPDAEFTTNKVGPVERLVSLSDMELVLKFFHEVDAEPEITKLVIHCKSGVSRSAAIAQWLGNHYDIDAFKVGPDKRISPSPRVMRLLDAAYTKYRDEHDR